MLNLDWEEVPKRGSTYLATWQELTIEQIQAILLCYGMIPVGGHAPAFQGATLVSTSDSIAQDDLGLKTAAQLGTRVGEIALTMASSGALFR